MNMTPEQKALFDKMTPFLQSLAPCILRNMKQADAYRVAKPDSTNSDGAASAIVCKAIQRPDFVAFMDSMRATMISDAIMTREEALERLSTLARENDAKTIPAIQQLTVMQGWAKPVKLDHSSKDGSMTPRPALDVTKLSTEALLEIMNASKSDE